MAELLRRGQLAMFIASTEDGWTAADFDLGQMGQTGGCFITFKGVSYYATGIDDLRSPLSVIEYRKAVGRPDADAARREVRDKIIAWVAELALDAVSELGGPTGKVAKGAALLIEMGELAGALFALAHLDTGLSEAERRYLEVCVSAATIVLGGGAAFVETPTGLRMVGGGVLATQEAQISLGGLRRDLGLSEAEAYAILIDDGHPRHSEVVGYLEGKSEGDRFGYIRLHWKKPTLITSTNSPSGMVKNMILA